MKLATFSPSASSGEYGERVAPKELVGAVLLIQVNKVQKGVTTKFGVKDAIDIDVCGVVSGKVATDQRWFNGAIVDSLAPYVGQIVPVKLAWAQGTGNPYLVAEAVTEAEARAAQDFLDRSDPFGGDRMPPGPDPVAPPFEAPRPLVPVPTIAPATTPEPPRW